MGFKPSDHKSSEGGQPESSIVPPGTYVIALIKPKLIQSKQSNHPMAKRLRGVWRVLGAQPDLQEHVGAETWMGFSVDVRQKNIAGFLGRICDAMGLDPDTEFEPHLNADIRKHMCFRPVCVTLKKETQGQYTNNEFGRFISREQLQQSTRDQMEVWRADLLQEFADDSNDDGGWGPDDPGPGDGDAPAGPGKWDLPF